MEIWFYHLTRQRLESALPTLLERSIERGWRAVVQARGEERVRALDETLWTYSDEAFLAHGTAAEGDAEMQPVLLTTDDGNPNAASVRFFVESAEITPEIAADPAYARLILMFDGNDDEELRAARGQWRALKSAGHDLSYWKQGESGGWEKMAV